MDPWLTHRQRAEVLRERQPFAEQVLTCYLALLDVWTDSWRLAQADPPVPADLARWAGEHVLPQVVRATLAAGPEKLAIAASELLDSGDFDAALAGWLAGSPLDPVESYLARASLTAPLVALGENAGAACVADTAQRGERRCPRCAGAPQLSFRHAGGEPLVSGRRSLACARCSQTWSFSSSACAFCGETTGSARTVYALQRNAPIVGPDSRESDPGEPEPTDEAMLGHLRIEACASCDRYLIDVDLGRDPRAVPEVDELAALPLDLYATEHELSKITPNLMGF